MDKEMFGATIRGFILGIIVGVVSAGQLMRLWNYTYRHGQIDALSGKIRYELVVHPDSTRTWEKKGDGH